MSAPTVLKETGLRLTIHLLASNRMCGSGVVSGSVCMFPMYREHQCRGFVKSNTVKSGSIVWTVCRLSGQLPALFARRSSFTSDTFCPYLLSSTAALLALA